MSKIYKPVRIADGDLLRQDACRPWLFPATGRDQLTFSTADGRRNIYWCKLRTFLSKKNTSAKRENYYMTKNIILSAKKQHNEANTETGSRVCVGPWVVCMPAGPCLDQEWPVEKFVCSLGYTPGVLWFETIKNAEIHNQYFKKTKKKSSFSLLWPLEEELLLWYLRTRDVSTCKYRLTGRPSGKIIIPPPRQQKKR